MSSKCWQLLQIHSQYTSGWRDPHYPTLCKTRNPPLSLGGWLPSLCFGISLLGVQWRGEHGMISLEYSFPGIPRAGSSLFLLLSDPPYFKTHPWSDPQTVFYVTLGPDLASWGCLGQGPVHRTFSRIHPQKCFLLVLSPFLLG